jgi:hypothetical protein
MVRRDGKSFVQLDNDFECKTKDGALLYFARKYYSVLQSPNSIDDTFQSQKKRIREIVDALKECGAKLRDNRMIDHEP